MNKQKAQIVFSIAALALAGVLIGSQLLGGNAAEDVDQTTFWICRTEGCRAEFTATYRQVLAQANSDGNIACPECGKSLTSRALQCPLCKRAIEPVGHGGMPDTCVHCKAAIPREAPPR